LSASSGDVPKRGAIAPRFGGIWRTRKKDNELRPFSA
jgi:hypothetical protein